MQQVAARRVNLVDGNAHCCERDAVVWNVLARPQSIDSAAVAGYSRLKAD